MYEPPEAVAEVGIAPSICSRPAISPSTIAKAAATATIIAATAKVAPMVASTRLERLRGGAFTDSRRSTTTRAKGGGWGGNACSRLAWAGLLGKVSFPCTGLVRAETQGPPPPHMGAFKPVNSDLVAIDSQYHLWTRGDFVLESARGVKLPHSAQEAQPSGTHVPPLSSPQSPSSTSQSQRISAPM